MGSSPVAVTQTSDFAPVSSKEFPDIQETTKCGFVLKRASDMIRTYTYCNKTYNAELTMYLVCDFVKFVCMLSWFLVMGIRNVTQRNVQLNFRLDTHTYIFRIVYIYMYVLSIYIYICIYIYIYVCIYIYQPVLRGGTGWVYMLPF